MPFPPSDNPVDRQFKIRVSDEHLETLDRYVRDGVTLPERRIPPGLDKSKLARMALGLEEAVDTTPGVNALDELTRRVRKG